MKTVTEFGRLIRKIRIDRSLLLKEMADRLGVTSAYLSAVELGKKNIPQDLVNKICEVFNLKPEEKIQLNESVESSQPNLKIDLTSSTAEQRELVLHFARKYDGLSIDKLNKIKELLKG